MLPRGVLVSALSPLLEDSKNPFEVLRLGLARHQSENLHHSPRGCQDQSMKRSTQPRGGRNLGDRFRQPLSAMPVLARTQTAAGSLMRAADFELDWPVRPISRKSNLRGRTLSLRHTASCSFSCRATSRKGNRIQTTERPPGMDGTLTRSRTA